MNDTQDTQMNEAGTSTSGGGKGTMIGTIIVIIILIIGAIYLFMGKAEAPVTPNNDAETGVNSQPTTVGSDEVADIEADLSVVSQDSDEQISAIEQGLGQ